MERPAQSENTGPTGQPCRWPACGNPCRPFLPSIFTETPSETREPRRIGLAVWVASTTLSGSFSLLGATFYSLDLFSSHYRKSTAGNILKASTYRVASFLPIRSALNCFALKLSQYFSPNLTVSWLMTISHHSKADPGLSSPIALVSNPQKGSAFRAVLLQWQWQFDDVDHIGVLPLHRRLPSFGIRRNRQQFLSWSFAPKQCRWEQN